MFLGKEFTLQELENLTEKEIDKYYTLYESTYSRLISDNLIKTSINCFSKLSSYIIPIDNEKQLSEDIQNNFLVSSELKKLTGSLAYNFGPILAVMSSAVDVASHIQLKKKPVGDEKKGDSEGRFPDTT